MVELAVAGITGFRVSRIEIDRPGTSYTVDTLEALKTVSGSSSELYFIIGFDSLGTLAEWKDSDRIVKLCRLVTVKRPGYDIPDLKKLEKQIPGLTDSLIILNGPLVDISSTNIRRCIAEGRPFGDMVPPAVETYIKVNHLYI